MPIKKILLLFILTITPFLTCYSTDKETIKIGFVLPLSGNWAHLGAGIKNSALLAQEDFQSDKFNYQLIFEDNRGSLKDSVLITKKLINLEKVDALISIISGVGQVINPLAEQSKVLNFGICSNKNVAKGTYNFINYLTAEQGVRKYLKEVSQRYPTKGKIKLTVFALNEFGFNLILDELTKQTVNTNIVLEYIQKFEPETKDFKAAILRTIKADTDLVLILGLSPEIEVLAKQIQGLGKNLPLTSIESFGLADNKEFFEGAWFVDAAVPNKAFQARYKNKYKKEVSAGCGHAYDTVMMIAEAIEELSVEGEKPAPKLIAKKLAALENFQGVLGSSSSHKNGIITTDPSIKTIINGKIR